MNYLQIQGVRPTGKVLGSGSYGEVIEVEWCSTICAAKRMHDIFNTFSKGELDKMVKDFEKECQIWSSLRHPNIVLLLGIYYPPKSRVPQFVLEKMDTSLRHYLEGHSREEFLLPDKVSILRQVAQGLCYLHSQNPPLVHHDLSPNNILLNEWTFQTKLTDFGMTRAINLSKLTRKSSVKGTQPFMSPEALYNPPRYTEKLDVFSFGNCIATTLTHEWPNPSHPTLHKWNKLVALTEFERRQHLFDLMGTKERELFLPIIQKCLANQPESRPSSSELVLYMKKMESAIPDLTVALKAQKTMSELVQERQQNESLENEMGILQIHEANQEATISDLLASRAHMQIKLSKFEEENSKLQEENKKLLQRQQIFEAAQKEKLLALETCIAQLEVDNRRLQQSCSQTMNRSDSSISQLPQLRDWTKIEESILSIKEDAILLKYEAVTISKAGTLAVIDGNEKSVVLFDKDGFQLKKFYLEKSIGRVDVFGIAFTRRGNIALATEANCVCILSPDNGELLSIFGMEGVPWGLAPDHRGYLYICERDRNCISVYTEDGAFVNEFGSKGWGQGELSYPWDAAFGPDGNLYVCDFHNKRIQIFDEKGKYLKEFKTSDKPKHICVANDGHVIVAQDSGHLYIFDDHTHALVHKWTFKTNRLSYGVAVNSDGQVFVPDSGDIKVF